MSLHLDRGAPRLIGHEETGARPEADVWVLRTRVGAALGVAHPLGEIGAVLARYVPDEELLLVRDGYGKPRLANVPNVQFSVSRSSGVTLVAVSSDAAVGVDVERLGRRGLHSLPAHALTPNEQSDLRLCPEAARADAFLSVWVRKEAILKAAGVGLGVEPVLVEVSRPTEHPFVSAVPDCLGTPRDWTLVDVDVPGCAAAVAVRKAGATVRMIDW